jgi:hypothetical protein
LRHKFNEVTKENIKYNSKNNELKNEVKFEKDIVIDQLKNESRFKQNLIETMQIAIDKKETEITNLKSELYIYQNKLNKTRNEL